MTEINSIELGWFAGIIDAKGHVTYKNNKTRNSVQVVMYVQSKNIAIIQRLNQLTGTSPDLQEPKPIRDFMRKMCTEHCPEKHIHIHINDNKYYNKDALMPSTARWTVTGASMAVIIWNLLPYLADKKDYESLIEFVFKNTTMVGQGSGMVLQGIRRLQLLGWRLPEMFIIAMR